jgi:hypothetical protein
MRWGLFILPIVVMLVQSDLSYSKDFPVTARAFGGGTEADLDILNQEMTAQNLKEIDTVAHLGFEATHAAFKFFEYGFRYTKRYAKQEELVANSATDYYGELNQESVMLVARVPVIKTNIIRFDLFGGVGGTNTTFKLKSATVDGEISKKEAGDWFAAPITSFGGSFGVGYKKFYLVVEGGIEANKIDKLKRTGNISTNINEIDLSGAYFTVGLLFDGLSGSRK